MIAIKPLVQKCHDAAPQLRASADKNKILGQMAESLTKNSARIIQENKKDLEENQNLSPALLDRLALNEKGIRDMADGLEEVASLPDPVGKIVSEWERPNGLRVQRMRIPLGVVGVIYESRPNVTVDSAGLCFKSGNAVVLRGGSEAFNSNKILAEILGGVLQQNNLPREIITLIPTTDRKALLELLSLTKLVDVLIPRGGEGLMKFMEENSKIPIIKHDKGVCNLYIDKTAQIDMAIDLTLNSKVQRAGVCNALENLFVHETIAPQILPKLVSVLKAKGVEIRGDDKTQKMVDVVPATEEDFYTEYLDLILSVKIVVNIDEAISCIRKYGSSHTEAIVSEDPKAQELFIRSLDSSCVLVNAGTRFNDGGQLGLGMEIGISTSKLHAFGPMGLEELTTTKFVVYGKGQTRQ